MDSTVHVKHIGVADFSLWQQKIPPKIDFELTRRCNNNCIHCLINLPEDDPVSQSELTTQEVEGLLEQIADLGCLMVRFTGGEPLLRKDFEDIYLFARKLGLQVSLFTNATLITERIARTFSEIPPLKKIDVTLYGIAKTSYERVSLVEGSFDQAWQGVQWLLKYQVPFYVRSVRLFPNCHEVEIFRKWASTIPWMKNAPSIVSLFNLRCYRDSERKNRQIRKLRLSPEELVEISLEDKDFIESDLKPFCQQRLSVQGDHLLTCAAALSDGCISADGFLYPCYSLRPQDMAYNLRTGSLEQGFNVFFPSIRTRKVQNPDYLLRCAKCFIKNLCQQCPASAYSESGEVDMPVDYYCSVTHALAKRIGLLDDCEKAWEIKSWENRTRKMKP